LLIVAIATLLYGKLQEGHYFFDVSSLPKINKLNTTCI
jgi:hypothetical protein